MRAYYNMYFYSDDHMHIRANNSMNLYANTTDGYNFYIGTINETTETNKVNMLRICSANSTDGIVNINANRVYLTKNLTVNDSINALYFNATSDRRAKENLTPLNQSALEIINQAPVYTFNYKENKHLSIGLVAQDLVNIKLNNFCLVDHLSARGEKGDYMSIRETKLVYVL